MANSEHLAKLKEGVEAWNDWRMANPKIVPDLRDAHLSGADLGGAHLDDAYLNGADLSDAYLGDAHLTRTDLIDADLTGAGLSEAYLVYANLTGANLSEADLTRAYLGDAHLDDAHLTRADLGGAYLDDAHLNGADLREADLEGANLGGADLSAANLGGANLIWANLNSASLIGADLTGASIAWTSFDNNDLSDVKGLEAVQHKGPSTIGIDTIYRSHGKIPLAFLRGAGVPENFIEYMGSLTGKALEFYSCFISYSTKNEDQEFADRLYADLQNKGVRCWFAPHDIQAGKKIHEQIDAAIRMHEKLLL